MMGFGYRLYLSELYNIKIFDSIKIPVPLLAVQQSLVSEIVKIETRITAAQKIIDEASSKKQAILKKYL